MAGRKLIQHSKEDLIWIINRMALRNGEYELNLALRDLAHKKEQQRYEEADRYAKIAHAKRMEYLELLKPYDGQRFIDIPMDVLEKADKAMKEAQAADAKWNKLMGIQKKE